MSKFLILCLSVSLLTFSPPAWACDVAEPSWRVQSDRMAGVVTLPGEPIVLLLKNETGAPALDESLSVVLLRAGDVVSSRFEVDVISAKAARLVITPDEPIDSTSAYTLEFDAGLESFWSLEPGSLALIVESPAAEAQPTITSIEGAEARTGADYVCCDTECSTGCDDLEVCELCWPTNWTYPVVASLQWESGGLPIGLYDFELYRKDEGGEPERVELLDIISASEFADSRGIASPRFAEDWTGERCVRVDAVHYDTGERILGEWACLESFESEERRDSPPVPDANGCEGPLLNEDGEEYQAPSDDTSSESSGEPSDETTSGGRDGGCSSLGVEQPPLWLFALLLLVRRRRNPVGRSLCSSNRRAV